jgi:hypothetical protein
MRKKKFNLQCKYWLSIYDYSLIRDTPIETKCERRHDTLIYVVCKDDLEKIICSLMQHCTLHSRCALTHSRFPFDILPKKFIVRKSLLKNIECEHCSNEKASNVMGKFLLKWKIISEVSLLPFNWNL